MRSAGVDPRLLRASLLGGAVGDSLGAEIEFWSLDQIRQRFPGGLTDLPPHDGIRGAITDDTQMTLFTAEGILDAYERGMDRGIWHPPSSVHLALLRWLETQGHPSDLVWPHAGLITDRRMHARRAPGLTCLAALKATSRIGEPARNDSKGCGTIMRVAPIALMLPRTMVQSAALECSAFTHGHPTGQRAAAAWAELLRAVAEGADLETTAAGIAQDHANLLGDETAQAITRALQAPRDGRPETVETLGGGWVAEEALSIALYACLAGQSFEHALRIAVTHGGDSDSTGAIAGNMLGLVFTQETIGHRWASQVECASAIDALTASYASLMG
jgi:ADP-ribosylglycohydrolase